jgi:hypothetical protein
VNVWLFSALFALPFAGIVVIAGIADLRQRQKHGRPRRGTPPGQGDTLVNHGNEMGGGHGGGHPTAHRVTKDPQLYAKAFVPETAEKDN